MPYVKQQARQDMLAGIPPKNPGDLNYLFCIMILGKAGQKSFPKNSWTSTFLWMIRQYVKINGGGYQAMNDAYGAAILAVREVEYRTNGDYGFGRLALLKAADEFWIEDLRPYEAKKIAENGDVFDPPQA